MSSEFALVGARIFDGSTQYDDHALMIDGRRVAAIRERGGVPAEAKIIRLDGGILVPGFIDLQVNGGGGVLLNDDPSVAGIETICAAHRQFGTTALLPTLITDTPAVTRAAIESGIEATTQNVPGFAGLHIEGPHLSVERKGAHRADLIRPMTDEDLALLLRAADALPRLMVTVAPETATGEQISAMNVAGICVSLGHSAAGLETARAAVAAGARTVTHLFNAMSGLTHRDPGLVGAALAIGPLHAGLIADGIHVHPETLSIALRAKRGPGRLFLVTDAMSTIGTDISSFELNGRTIHRRDGRLTLDDGTLAGADLDMASAVRFIADTIGLGLDEAVRMASTYPADVLGAADMGHLQPGARANVVHFDDDMAAGRVWIDGDDGDQASSGPDTRALLA